MKRPLNLLRPTALPTNQTFMTYSGKTRTFIVDASDLMGKEPSLVYNDACDGGYTLVSHKTGNEVVVAHKNTIMKDGELVSWIYKSVWPKDANITLEVRND